MTAPKSQEGRRSELIKPESRPPTGALNLATESEITASTPPNEESRPNSFLSWWQSGIKATRPDYKFGKIAP